MASISEQLKYIMSLDASQAIKSFQQVGATADKELSKADSRLDKLGGNLTKVGAGAVAFAGIAGAGLVKVAQGASNLAESVNAVNVTFGDAAEGILELGENAATAVGLSKTEFNGLAVQFSSFAETVAGRGGDVVGTMDTLTTRVADFASVMNLDVPKAAEIFQSALAGETEPIKKFGIDLSAATVEAYAAANGIGALGEKLTETEKVQARYGLLMESTNKTAGDFANTSDGLANRQRILKAELKNLSDDIGTGVLPMLTSVVAVAGKAVGAFSELSPATKALAGRFAAIGVAGVGMLGTISLIAGQVIKMRARFVDADGTLTTFGKTAKGLGITLGVVALATAAWSANQSRLQGSLDDSIRLTEELGRVTDAALGDVFLQAVAAATMAGKSLEEALAGIAAQNIEGAQRALENADAIGLSASETAKLKAAIDAEITARETQKATTEQYAAAEESAAVATEDAAVAAESLIDSYEATTLAADMASFATDAKKRADEEAVDAAEEHTEAMEAQADTFADNAAAALSWMGDLQGSMDSAGGAISTFTDEALGDIDTFQAELAQNTGDLHGWQDDIVSIASKTSPEFAGFLAEMGLAGSKLVDDLEGNEGELETTFEQWKLAAAVAARDVPGEIAKADPETQRIIEQLGRNVIGTLDGQVAPTKAASLSVGQAIVDGMRVGVNTGARQVGVAAAKVVTDALAAAKAAGKIESPSKLFADEVGHPIVEGIEEGILEDAASIGKALERAIESAEKDALNAVDDLVDAAKDRFKEAWGDADDARDMERLNERVSDAQIDVAEAQTKVNETAAEFGVGSREHLKALESLSDAERSLRDAHFALLESSQALLDQGPAGQAAFEKLAWAAGLEFAEIVKLIGSYRELVTARAAAAAAAAAVKAEADQAQATRAEFGVLAAQGAFSADQLNHLKTFGVNDPAFTLALMRAYIDGLPSFAGGGIVPGPVGSPQLVVAHGGEPIGMNGNGHGAPINVTVNAGMGANGAEIGDIIVGKIREYERRNGPGWRG